MNPHSAWPGAHTTGPPQSDSMGGGGREGRWAGLDDAIDQMREWRDVCTVNLGLLAKLQELAIHC